MATQTSEDFYLETGKQYQALSIKDLLEARDAYHVFLMRKRNVIGTAIGKFRIRKNGVPDTAAKTLDNTEVRKYSWPCVVVFVRDWLRESDFGKGRRATSNDYLPLQLYLPDGQEVPLCVIKATWSTKGPDVVAQMKFPGSFVGGGYPVMTRVQGEQRWATLGCLVSDGRIIYGLTNSHVAGRPRESLFTMINGNEEEIGVSSAKHIQKKPFSEIYESFPGRHTLANLDIGLIELNDVHRMTSQIYGLGEVEGILDVNHDTLSLNLIGCPVKGFGCASGLMQGEIIGLFYRYATAGGYDYVAEYLVGPRSQNGEIHNGLLFAPGKGDSGTLLVVDAEPMKAIAVLWGGQREVTEGHEQPYGLATNLGTICRQLEVELVSDWNTGYDVYFGAAAHVMLPSLCVSVVQDKDLRKLMENNADSFSMPPGKAAVKATKGLSKADFVPLSDVADLVWKLRGGKFQRGKEGPNHFADMDQPNPKDNGRTLLDLCNDPKKVEPNVWVNFYKSVNAKEKGALPFRIAQIYDAMLKAVEQGETSKFVCAAGILTHYVFDACMPMHISQMHHGDPNHTTIDSKGKEKPLAYNVHAEFDNQMVEYYVDTIDSNLPRLVREKASKNKPVKVEDIRSTRDAAVAAVTLMQDTVKYADPADIVKDFEDLIDLKKRARCDQLWKKYGYGMLKAMAEGVVLAARLWEAAWVNGNGKKHIKSTDAVSEDELKQLYETKVGFLNSVNLEDIKSEMTW